MSRDIDQSSTDIGQVLDSYTEIRRLLPADTLQHTVCTLCGWIRGYSISLRELDTEALESTSTEIISHRPESLDFKDVAMRKLWCIYVCTLTL